jgi:hypothetical protein
MLVAVLAKRYVHTKNLVDKEDIVEYSYIWMNFIYLNFISANVFLSICYVPGTIPGVKDT